MCWRMRTVGFQNELDPADFQSSVKITRSYNESFPWMKAQIRERATDQNINNASSHRVFIKTPKRKLKTKQARNTNADMLAKHALMKTKLSDSSNDSIFTRNPEHTGKEDGNPYSDTAAHFFNSEKPNVKMDFNYEGSQNQNQELPSNLDDNQLNENPNEHSKNGNNPRENLQKSNEKYNLVRQLQKTHKHKKPHFRGGKYGHKPVKESNTETGKRDPEASISNNDNMSESEASINNEDSSRRKSKISDSSSPLGSTNHDKEVDHYHEQSPEKKHVMRHHFKGFLGKKHIPSNFQTKSKIANRPMYGHDETSNPKPSEETQNGNYVRPSSPEYDSINSPLTHKRFEQNDSLQGKQSSNFVTGQSSNSNNLPLPDKEPNSNEERESLDEPMALPGEQLNQYDVSEGPYETNVHLNPNYLHQDNQMSNVSIIPQNNFNNSPNDGIPNKIEHTAEGITKKSLELFKPILFKLRESSPLIGPSMSNINDTESPRKAKQVESKNKDIQNSNDERDTREKEFGRENPSMPDPFFIYTTNKDIEDSSLQDTATQQVGYFDTTNPHNLTKKSYNLYKYYNKYPIYSEENYPYEDNSEGEQVYIPNKRSNDIESNIDKTYLNEKDMYKREENTITTTTVQQETVTSNSPSQNDLIESFTSESQTSDSKTETSTSIIQKYAMPTLGIANKILKSLNFNRKRAPSQNSKPNFKNLHTDLMHFRNTKYIPLNAQNFVQQHGTKVRSNEDNPATEKYKTDKELYNKPKEASISKRNEGEGTVTRTYDILKTKQTIVKDSLTNKTTNVLENEKKKIVDSIRLTKQSKLTPPNEDTVDENQDSASWQQTGDDDIYSSEYENGENGEYEENVENYISESGINGQMNPQTTEEMYYDADGNFVDRKDVSYSRLNNDHPKGTMNISLNQKSNTFKTDMFKNPPGINKNDYSAAQNNEVSQNGSNNPVPLASDFLPQPRPGYSYAPKTSPIESNNMELPNNDEYSYQDQYGESESGEQHTFFQENKSVPEQSTDNFIDLGEQEEKKDDVFEDLNKFPTSKINNKPRGHMSMSGPGGQKENQRSFYEFSTILSDAHNMGEFQREEKVERQSKVIHKKDGMVTNGTASLFGEKKIEVKDNKQNYHETYMEEKGESKFPNQPTDDSEKHGISSETSVKSRQTPERQYNKENNPEFISNGNLVDLFNRDADENDRPQFTKDKKSADYDDEENYNEYYYATENNPESMMDPADQADEEYEEYVVNPNDVLKNDGRIDGISKRSGALIDVSKLGQNGKALRSSELPTSQFIESSEETVIASDPTVTTPSTDEQLNREHRIRTSNELTKKNAAGKDTTNEPQAVHSFNKEDSLGSNISSRKIEQDPTPSSREDSGLPKNNGEPEKPIERRIEETELATRSVHTGSGNIVYVTVASTTDSESKFHDFLQIQEAGRKSRQLQRRLGDVNRKKRKHSPRQKLSKFLTNYRINRSSNYRKNNV